MKRMLIVGGLAGLLVIALWVTSFCVVRAVWSVPDNGLKSLEQYGQFGDSFGAVNALFSGLAFAGVVVALILQREDIDKSLGAQKDAAQSQDRQAKVATFAAIIEAEKTLSDYYQQAAQDKAPPPIPNQPEISWADMMASSRKSILEMRAELVKVRDKLIQERL